MATKTTEPTRKPRGPSKPRSLLSQAEAFNKKLAKIEKKRNDLLAKTPQKVQDLAKLGAKYAAQSDQLATAAE